MHTIYVNDFSPLVVIAAVRGDDCARIDGMSVNYWLTLYWQSQIRDVLPQPHDENPALALSYLADTLASEDITEAVGVVLDYREFTGRTINSEIFTRMIISDLLDWSKWTGDPRIDDTRAQSWLRSLLT